MLSKLLAFIVLFSSSVRAVDSAEIPNRLINFNGHLEAVLAGGKIRETHRISELEFLRMAKDPHTVILDARSRPMFERLHVSGAVNLSFPDFTEETLAKVIPSKSTHVLIYCNNNFLGDPSAFPSKNISVALNLSTFVALHAYGYENVYELGPLVQIEASRLPLVGTEKIALKTN